MAMNYALACAYEEMYVHLLLRCAVLPCQHNT
jgi:hypothetical protein